MGFLVFFIYILICIVSISLFGVDAGNTGGTAKRCIKVTSIITSFGDGSTEDSCMGCDPARPDCAIGCQNLIDSMYIKCDGVCMPDGYYYDPLSTITGCWEDVKPQLKIGVERCGCNTAASTISITISSLCFIIILCILTLI